MPQVGARQPVSAAAALRGHPALQGLRYRSVRLWDGSARSAAAEAQRGPVGVLEDGEVKGYLVSVEWMRKTLIERPV